MVLSSGARLAPFPAASMSGCYPRPAPDNPLLEPEDLRHEARLLDAGRAREAHDRAAGGPLDGGAEARSDRVLVLGPDLQHRVLSAVLDQELLVRKQLELVQHDDHPVLR